MLQHTFLDLNPLLAFALSLPARPITVYCVSIQGTFTILTSTTPNQPLSDRPVSPFSGGSFSFLPVSPLFFFWLEMIFYFTNAGYSPHPPPFSCSIFPFFSPVLRDFYCPLFLQQLIFSCVFSPRSLFPFASAPIHNVFSFSP